MKSVFTLIFSLFVSASLFAQSGPSAPANPVASGRISGTVVDSVTSKPVEFATVTLISAASGKPVNGSVTDDEGGFQLSKVEDGAYSLKIAFLGFADKTVGGISIVNGSNLNLGNIRLSSGNKTLNEVTVTATRPLIEEKVDRTIYNADVDKTTQGGDATDVLKRVPMLSVDLDGNVSLRGNSNIRVLINNKPSTITANSVGDALKQIPADLIKTVEVITSPSAKYDAEGSGGIINIITKKNTLRGFSLGINSSAGLRGSDLGLNGSLRTGKMGFSLGGWGRAGYNTPGSFSNYQLTSGTVNTQSANTQDNNLFGRYNLGWDYDIDTLNSLSASVSYGLRNRKSQQYNLFTQTFQSDALLNSSLRDVNMTDNSATLDASLTYTHLFKKPQQEFSLLALYSRNDRQNDFVNEILNETDQTVASRLKNTNPSLNQEYTVEANFQTPIGKNQLLEVGGKDIIRKVNSDFSYFTADGATGAYTPVQDAQLSNAFSYDQNVAAGYLAYSLSFLKNYSVKAGARYEYTTINANYLNQPKIDIPSYSVLVPSFNISRTFEGGSSLKAAYNRRIQRPSLEFLNPNIQASNPLNITIGNPELRPEYTDNYELAYSMGIKGNFFTLSTFMRNTNNAIQGVRSTIGDTIQTSFQNIGSENAYGFSLFANISLSNKLKLNGGTDTYYTILSNNVADPLYNARNTGWVSNYRLFGSYDFTPTWGFQFFSFYRSARVQLQGTQGGFGIYSLSLRKQFNNKKGSIGFGADNFLSSTFKIQNQLTSPVLDQDNTILFNNRGFKLTFSYNIGKLNASEPRRRSKKSINNDDMKEGGGDNQQQSQR
ncbi:MAG: TonB-dependent receptor [Mucilaginibacter polytrichastri]|nr:TonB-dependent receptor [Mucilaginibacter polytrichastri]